MFSLHDFLQYYFQNKIMNQSDSFIGVAFTKGMLHCVACRLRIVRSAGPACAVRSSPARVIRPESLD